MNPRHPYVGLPDRQFWKHEPGIADPAAFDPVSDVPFHIAPEDKVVTAGSCFAQHVARRLSNSGFNHLITEPAPAFVDPDLAERFNYGMFSARYGNIYTTRQLRQLVDRAYGRFRPLAAFWPKDRTERVIDPFRPQIQPEGFVSEAELLADRESHFAAVRSAFENMDVFVFTLGLTECWADVRDGAVFPLAPGVAGGRYRPGEVRFLNFDLEETLADLLAALAAIRAVNPTVRFILTVSPVPLNATMEPRHVYVSSAWSKSVLRLAAERVTRLVPGSVYFPSYEIITAPHVRGRYFGEDCREVLPDGVDHVMRLFFRHFAGEGRAGGEASDGSAATQTREHVADLENCLRILCDEEAIANR
ncbi:GSCFA domain-containing protein [Ostreiculturibacter nitratireducens]|uniref:GSCFA domain-containing protein n=1 Tax=Ostreiculturibacter nitratireducens TaxID=3075226 RepID=UPI0031B60325